MNHYLYMKRECLLFWLSIERQIVWLQAFFRRIYYPKTDVFAEELSNTFRLYKFLTMYCQNQQFFYTIYKWKPLCQKKERYFTKEKFECCHDVKFSAHLRLVAEKYHVLIILLAIYTMKRYPHVKQMHWWMSPYVLHFILFTLQTPTLSLYFVFNSPIMFSLSFDCWQHAML